MSTLAEQASSSVGIGSMQVLMGANQFSLENKPLDEIIPEEQPGDGWQDHPAVVAIVRRITREIAAASFAAQRAGKIFDLSTLES
jgi:hypothetical protein